MHRETQGKIKQWLDALRQAVVLDLPYSDGEQRHFAEAMRMKTIPSAVLILIGFSRDFSEPSVLYLKRAESVENHKGQMAFPGGLFDMEDQGDPDKTALRETKEEVGISGKQIHILGKLPILATRTGFQIQPVVGWIETPLEDIILRPNPDEVADVTWIPFSVLRNPGTYRSELFSSHLLGPASEQVLIHVYQVDKYRIWGATGSMTKNLIDRLERVSD